MVNEVLLSCECLAAVSTGVRSDAGVLSNVIVQMFLTREGTRTVGTLVWSFAGVLSAQQSTFRFENAPFGI